MVSANSSHSRAEDVRIQSGSLVPTKIALNGHFTIPAKHAPVYLFDPNGSNRDVTFPSLNDPQFVVICHVGTANTLQPKTAAGVAIGSPITAGAGSMFFGSGSSWAQVPNPKFSDTVAGLVPHPGPAHGDALFLRSDGEWGQVQSVGIVDAFKFITDGTTIAIGSGPDTFKLRSADARLTIVVQNNDATHGDNALFSVVDAAIDHDALLNYVDVQHVDHSAVSVSPGDGLSGGGTLEATRTLSLNITGLTGEAAIAVGDEFAFYDLTAVAHRKATLAQLNAVLDHDALANFAPDEHIAHAGVSITAGTGLSGGGTIESTRTLNLDFTSLPTDDLPELADYVAGYDVSESDHQRWTLTQINAIFDHDALLGFVANEHIDHSAVSIATAAAGGLAGGGTIEATRNLTLAINAMTAAASAATDDEVAIHDTSAGAVRKVTVNQLGTALGAAKVLLATKVASNSATISFTAADGFGATYDHYEVVIEDLVPVTDGATLNLRTSTAGAFLTGASDYLWAHTSIGSGGGTGVGSSTGASLAEICAAVGNAAGEGAAATFRILGANGALRKRVQYQVTAQTASGGLNDTQGSVLIANTGALDGIRFQMGSGNISSGNFYLYGIRKA